MIDFDVETAHKSGFFISGTSGSGKTNLAFHLAKILLETGTIVHIFDPSQAWVKRFILPHYESREENKHINFNPQKSMVFDISRLYIGSMRKFVEVVVNAVFMSKINSVSSIQNFLIFEEAQLYFNQGCFKGGKTSDCKEALRVYTVGRNFGIRCGLITQFPANVDKLAVKMSEQRYFGQTQEKNDVEYISHFIEKEFSSQLQSLKVGEFIYDFGVKTKKIQSPIFVKGEKY